MYRFVVRIPFISYINPGVGDTNWYTDIIWPGWVGDTGSLYFFQFLFIQVLSTDLEYGHALKNRERQFTNMLGIITIY